MEAIDFIQIHPPFDCLDEAELKRVEQTFETVRFSPGIHILEQDGVPSRYLYMIREGEVGFVRNGQVIQVLEEGEVFGYTSMLNQNPPLIDVVAEADIVTYRIPEAVFHELVDNADFAEFFLKNLSERLRRSSRHEVPPFGGDLSTPIGTLVVRPPIFLSPTSTVGEAAQAMNKAWVDSVLVIKAEPLGIVTDYDFRVRVLAEGLGPETLVHQIMNQPLKTMPVETPVYEALLFMLEENIHHLALTREDEVVGVAAARDILRHQAKSPLYLLRHLRRLESPDSLARYTLDASGMVEVLFKGGLDMTHIGRVMASLSDTLIRRLLHLAEDELGPPPTPYAWIVFGSEGRMEQIMLTDQDNALVYLKDTKKARKYFKALTKRVVDGLIQAGFPPCPGGYMATKWCYPRDEWVRLFKSWIKTPDPQALLETAIFFDFRPVYGELSLKPLQKVISKARKQKIFLAHLAHSATNFRPPLNFFRRIRDEAGLVDLKAGGIAPIVSIARVYAIESRVRTRSTIKRLEAATEAGTLSREGAETLIETYTFLLRLRLREQLAAINAGNTPSDKIRLQSLSRREHRHLKEAFLAIREMQEALAQRFQTGLLG